MQTRNAIISEINVEWDPLEVDIDLDDGTDLWSLWVPLDPSTASRLAEVVRSSDLRMAEGQAVKVRIDGGKAVDIGRIVGDLWLLGYGEDDTEGEA